MKPQLPPPIVDSRKATCNCDCSVNFEDPCSFCPYKKWGQDLCTEMNFEGSPLNGFYNEIPLITQPSIASMIKTAVLSASNWATKGFQHTNEKVLKQRIETCESCEFWNAEGFNGTGRCMKCGCSTWAKLRMATEKCPLGKW